MNNYITNYVNKLSEFLIGFNKKDIIEIIKILKKKNNRKNNFGGKWRKCWQ